MGPIHTTDDLVDMVRRRVRLLLLVSVSGLLFSLLLALSQKHMYQSTEVIAITRPVIGNDLARPSDAGNEARRLSLIEHRLLTRANLIEIIDTYNLYVEYPDMKPGQMVDRLRQAVRIEGLAATRQGFGDGMAISVLSITAEMPIALQAQQVAHEIARRLIDLNTGLRVAQARETLAFFGAQQDMLAEEMRMLEDRSEGLPSESDLPLSESPQEQATYQRQQVRLGDELAMISARRTQAEIALRMENQGLVERLTTLDPAALPVHPMTSKRKRIAIIGGVLSVLLAFTLAFVQELRNPVIRTARQMQREIGFAPVVSIPYLDPTPPRLTLWGRFLAWLDGPEPSQTDMP